jgi:hypothetical protein
LDDVRAIGAWLAREGGELLGRLREPGLWAALLAGLLLWGLAYQVAPRYALSIGGDQATHKRGYDAPFLMEDSFHDAEPGSIKIEGKDVQWWQQNRPPYRWTRPEASVLLPGVGGGRWVVSVQAASGRPDGSAVESRWQVGDDAPTTLRIDAHPRVYTIVGGAPGGDLRLGLHAPRFDPPNDPRDDLGLVIHRIAVTPIDAPGPRIPAPGQLALLATIQLVCYSLARRLALPRAWTLLLALGVAAVTAAMLAAQRLALTIWTPALAALAIGCYLLAILLAPLLVAAVKCLLGPADVRVIHDERGAALAATVGAFALRMAGLLHPYAIFSDLGFNVNNLEEVIRGDLFLYAGLPAEAGGGRAPYPPAQYLALAPLRLLLGDDRRQSGLLIQSGNALLESCAAALIWLLLRRAGLGRRAALIGAALYVTIPPLLRSFSVGEFANIFGQGLLAPLLLFLTLGAPHARRWPAALVGGTLLLGILLSHTGVTISTLALLVIWLPLWWIERPSPPNPLSHAGERGSNDSPSPLVGNKRSAGGGLAGGGRRKAQPWRLLVAGAAAGLVALALFYSSYTGLLAQRRALAAALAPIAEPPPADRTFRAKVLGELRTGFSEAKGISLLLAIPGGLGVIWLWRRRYVRLDLALLACWLGALLSLATLLRTDQVVRWQAFLFPALCLGAAPMFAAWMRRGRAGAALALLALLYLTWLGITMWAQQVIEYLH